MLHTDLRYEASQSVMDQDVLGDEARVRAIFAALQDKASRHMRSWWNGPLRFEHRADMRYGEQVFEIDVDLRDLDFDLPGIASRMSEAFHIRHRAVFTYDLPEEPVMLVNARVAAVGALTEPGVTAQAAPAASRNQALARAVYNAGTWETGRFAGSRKCGWARSSRGRLWSKAPPRPFDSSTATPHD